jgi:hypothetical protein
MMTMLPKMRAKDFDARMRETATKRWSLKVLMEFEEPQHQFCNHYRENKRNLYNNTTTETRKTKKPKKQHRKLKPTKKNRGRRVGISMASACEPHTSFWRPLPTHESRTQPETNNSRGGEERRKKLGLHLPVKEIYFLARATHSPSSGYRMRGG